jgi:site-specific recombinase XerD
MNTPYFRSFLAPFLHQFVQYKRALNRKYFNDAETLRLFDRYLHNNDITDWHAVDSAVIDDFLKSRPEVGPKRYNLILYALRRFFAFAIMQQWTEQNPVTASPRRITGSRIPYLFDLETAKRLLAAARDLPERSRARYRGLVYETVFALLYGLGLRVGEVSRLKIGDTDFTRNLLFIRETKFAKSRIVPMGPQLAERLKHYVEQRYGGAAAAELPMFTFDSKRGSVDEGTISMTFHALLPKLALHIPPGVSPPRLHDLRHSFAVATLRRWYREGIDPNCRLMHLATFLGHVDPTSTSVYLTITEDLLNLAAQRFQALAPKGGAQ